MPHLPGTGRVGRALDIGCGAGLSTAALREIADYCLGIDPAEAMVHTAVKMAPGADLLVARAEALPLRPQSIDLITAAGSLNYTDLPLFFLEAARVLAVGGVMVVYDFSPGKSFRDSNALDEWFSSFIARYPWPSGEALELDPERLARADRAFHLLASENFGIGIPLTADFYVNYMMTETNVALALRHGESKPAIRRWCASTLGALWGQQSREVLFRGYWALLGRSPAEPVTPPAEP